MRAKDPLCARYRDPDPSRIALWHGNGDFGRHAWRDHAELPDSVAELPFGGRAGLLVRRFRRSRSDLDRTAYRQRPESGSEHTETSCKKLPHTCQAACPDALEKAHAPLLSGLAILSAPLFEPALDPILAQAPILPQPSAFAASANPRTCGQRKGVAHIPTGATTTIKIQFDCFGTECLGPARHIQTTVRPGSHDAPPLSLRHLCADSHSHPHVGHRIGFDPGKREK